MKLGPDVIQPQPQLIFGPCNTPQETNKKKKYPDWVWRAETVSRKRG